MRLLDYFKFQNRALNDFVTVSMELLQALSKGEFDKLQEFERKRDGYLKSFLMFEQRAQKINPKKDSLDSDMINQLWRIQHERKEFLAQIEELNKKIQERIEAEQITMKKQISDLHRQKERAVKFKSGISRVSGTGLDKNV